MPKSIHSYDIPERVLQRYGARLANACFRTTFERFRFDGCSLFFFTFHSLLIFISLKMVLLETGKTVANVALQNLIRFFDHKFLHSTAESVERKKSKESGKKVASFRGCEQFSHFPRGDLVISTAMDFCIEVALAFIVRF